MVYYIVGEKGKTTFLKSLGFPICRDNVSLYTSLEKGYKNICMDDVTLRNNNYFKNIFNNIVLGTNILVWRKFKETKEINPKKDLNLYVALHPSDWEDFPPEFKEIGVCLNIEQKEVDIYV